jgi:hypothetical protein
LLDLTESRVITHANRGAVNLSSAHIGGQFSCINTQLLNDSGAALAADSLLVDQGMDLDRFTAIGAGRGVTVDLRGGRVSGPFTFAPTRLEHKDDSRLRLAVDGLSYTGVPRGTPPWELRQLLRYGTPSYAAQPYEQLAAGYLAAGDESQARATLITGRDHEFAEVPPFREKWWWGKFIKVTVGYGYQPWRALAFAASVVALSCMLALVLGAHGALAQTDKTSTPGQPCTLLQQLSVGMDLNRPIGTSLAREDCALPKNPRVTASWLTGVGLVIRGLCGRSQPCSLTTAADPCARHNPRAGRCIRRRSNAQAGVHGFA